MTDDELDRLDALAQAATPGPWRDLTQEYFERCKADKAANGRRWYHGSMRASSPLALIVVDNIYGDPINLDHIPRRVDKYDFNAVFSLFWSTLPKKVTHMIEGFFRPEDAAFIAASRTAVPALIAEIRRLRALRD